MVFSVVWGWQLLERTADNISVTLTGQAVFDSAAMSCTVLSLQQGRMFMQQTSFHSHSQVNRMPCSLLEGCFFLPKWSFRNIPEKRQPKHFHIAVLQGWLTQRISNLHKFSLRGRLCWLCARWLIPGIPLFTECWLRAKPLGPQQWAEQMWSHHTFRFYFWKYKLPVEIEGCVFSSLREYKGG